MNRIYLDHASATPVAKEVVDAMVPFFLDKFGNPSSLHQEGVEAKKALDESRASIAKILDIHADEIIFTGSATESCNLALIGTVRAWKKAHLESTPHIIVSAIEHESILATAKFLEGEGALVSYLPVDIEGIVLLDTLPDLITEHTVIVSIMLANNEIGTIQPVCEVAHIIRSWKKEKRGVTRDVRAHGDQIYPLLHTDACQATNYIALRVPLLGVDLLTINGAKIYGPKGIALLVVRRPVPIFPIIVGGGHEHTRRAGTENIPLIVGFAHALRLTESMRKEESNRLTILRDNLIGCLLQIKGVSINGSLSLRLPNNVHFSLLGADYEFLSLLFDKEGTSVSTKSACNEMDSENSHVLIAMKQRGHLSPASGIRITLGRATVASDIETVLLQFSTIQNLAIASDALSS